MGFSEPRASQLLGRAEKHIREWFDENVGEY
jgi:hypothetical protein